MEQYKYLGITIDAKLTFGTNVAVIHRKVSHVLFLVWYGGLSVVHRNPLEGANRQRWREKEQSSLDYLHKQ